MKWKPLKVVVWVVLGVIKHEEKVKNWGEFGIDVMKLLLIRLKLLIKNNLIWMKNC